MGKEILPFSPMPRNQVEPRSREVERERMAMQAWTELSKGLDAIDVTINDIPRDFEYPFSINRTCVCNFAMAKRIGC